MPETSPPLSLLITNPDSVVFEGEIEHLIAPGIHGDLAILPEHTPLYAELKKGDLTIFHQGKKENIPLDGGILRVKNNKITIIVGF